MAGSRKQSAMTEVFTEFSVLVLSRRMKRMFEVNFGTLSTTKEGQKEKKKKKQLYQGKILVNYSCHEWTFLWVGGSVPGQTSI